MACCALTEGAEASRPQRRSRPPRQEKTPQQPRPHRATLRGFCLLPAPCPRCLPGPAAIPAPAPPSICVPRSTMLPRLWCWPRPCPPTCSQWSPWRSLGTLGTQGHQEEEEEAGTGRGSPHSHHASTTTAAAAASAAVRIGAQQCLWPGPASQWGVGTSLPSTASPRGAVTLQPSRCQGAALDLTVLTESRSSTGISWPLQSHRAALGPHGPRSVTERCSDLTAWHSVTAEFRRYSAPLLTLLAQRFSSETLVLPDFQW